MRRLIPSPKIRPATLLDARIAAARTAADAAQAEVDAVQAAPVVTTAATDAFSAEQVITGTPDGTKFLRDDLSWQTVTGGSAADSTVLDWLGW